MTVTTTRPTRLATTPREQALNDLFTTALEGGIGYWSVCSVYHWGVEVAGRLESAIDFVAVVQDVEDEDGTEYVIDKDVIRRGQQRLYKHLIGLGDEANRYHLQAMRHFNSGKWEDLDCDADTGDMVVQMGLFNEVRYG